MAGFIEVMRVQWSNQSLERTPDEQGCFASLDVRGRRSAHRWGNFRFARKSRRELLMSEFAEVTDRQIHAWPMDVFIPARTPQIPGALPNNQVRLFDSSVSISGKSGVSFVYAPTSSIFLAVQSPNQSLERTPDEQGCFASLDFRGRRSALR